MGVALPCGKMTNTHAWHFRFKDATINKNGRGTSGLDVALPAESSF